MKWSDIKQQGSSHYKGEKVEPIDLMKEGGILWNFAIGNIIKYAYRCRGYIANSLETRQRVKSDLDKLSHYCEMLKCLMEEAEEKK